MNDKKKNTRNILWLMAVICLMTGAIYAAPVFAMEEKGETDLASMTSEVIGEIVPDTVAGGMSADDSASADSLYHLPALLHAEHREDRHRRLITV